jgi:Cu/Ag efflux protein CusF
MQMRFVPSGAGCLLLGLVFMLASGCQQNAPESTVAPPGIPAAGRSAGSPVAPASGPADRSPSASPSTSSSATAGRTHQAHGVVKGFNADRTEITIAHGEIPSIPMEAMTMSYPVADTELIEGIAVSDEVDFVILQTTKGFSITHIARAKK